METEIRIVKCSSTAVVQPRAFLSDSAAVLLVFNRFQHCKTFKLGPVLHHQSLRFLGGIDFRFTAELKNFVSSAFDLQLDMCNAAFASSPLYVVRGQNQVR